MSSNNSSLNAVSMDKSAGACQGCGRYWPSFAAGVFIGLAFMVAAGWFMMPQIMLKVHESKYASVEETCQALKASIETAGWKCPAIRDMTKSIAQEGVPFHRAVRLVELCKADYAAGVLDTHPEVSTLMPCAFGVYEAQDGKVYISGMNMGLMGKMFGGRIAEIMGGKVAMDEHAILAPVVIE